MVTIELTDEEFYIMKGIMMRIFKQKERKPITRKWVKHDGCMINLQSGSMLDISSNKFVIDQEPDLRALADQMPNRALSNLATDLDALCARND